MAVAGLAILRWEPGKKRLGRWVMGASAVLLLAACGCVPAYAWEDRALNVFAGSMVIFGAAIPVLGMYMTVGWFRETLAEAKAYEPMEVALAMFSAAGVLVVAAAAVVFPVGWIVDRLPKWMEPVLQHVAWIFIAVACAILLKLGGPVGIMARRLAAVISLAICLAAEVGLFWKLREEVPQPLLIVATVTFLTLAAAVLWRGGDGRIPTNYNQQP